MNKCECGKFWEDDELRHETVSDPFCTGDSWYTVTEVFCPECGSDGLEEVHICLSCREAEAQPGLDECAPCFLKNGG